MVMRRAIPIALLSLGLVLPAAAQNPPEPKHEFTKAQRERAIARCKENRGADCATEEGLREWLLQERSRDEAERDASRSIHQTAPTPQPRAN